MDRTGTIWVRDEPAIPALRPLRWAAFLQPGTKPARARPAGSVALASARPAARHLAGSRLEFGLPLTAADSGTTQRRRHLHQPRQLPDPPARRSGADRSDLQ